MFECCKAYLTEGILETSSTLKVKRKHIRLKYGDEFIEWFDDWIQERAYESAIFTQLHEDFLSSTGTERKFFSSKRFSQGIHDSIEMIMAIPHIVVKKRVSGLNRGIEIVVKKVNP
jgi:hypothetical protein